MRKAVVAKRRPLPSLGQPSTRVKTEDSLPAFTFVDLFAGIGGFHLAMENLGGRCVMACEIDPDCRAVYSKRWKDVPLRGDIRKDITDRIKAGDSDVVPPHDVLCAGFPCQPFSKSGHQLGVRDRIRGTLFAEIMDVIRLRHPRYVILENVRNIAGPRHRDTWATIIESLRDEGYRVASDPLIFSPHLLPPRVRRRKREGGRPQTRDRVYILAEWTGTPSARPLTPLVPYAPVAGWDPGRWRVDDYLQKNSGIRGLADYRLRADELKWLRAWQDLLPRLKAPLPAFPIWVEAFELTPRIPAGTPEWKAEFIRKNSILYEKNQSAIDDWIKTSDVLAFPASRQKFEWQAGRMKPDIWKLVIQLRPSGIRVRPPTYVPALVAINQASVIGWRRRRITPREAARLQGFPEDFRLHRDPAVAYKQLGNAVNVGAATYVARALMSGTSQAVDQLSLELRGDSTAA